MHKKTKEVILLVSLILIFLIINYSFINIAFEKYLSNSEYAAVQRVVDGDTVIINDKSVRLLGINSPEKGKPYYNEAKEFLEMITLNKTVELKFGRDKYDKYNRTLAYIFVKGKNVNLELVDEGLANFYFPSGKDSYYKKFVRAWEKCIRMDKYLCEKSNDKCASCIELKEFNSQDEIIVLNNKCNFNCDLSNWEIKDQGRKNFIFEEFVLEKNQEVKIIVGQGTDNNSDLFWEGEDYVWTKTGDTLFLRDGEGKLVLDESY